MGQDKKYGYSDDMWALSNDIRMNAKFIYSMVKLQILPKRVGEVLVSNYGQKRFEQLVDDFNLQ